MVGALIIGTGTLGQKNEICSLIQGVLRFIWSGRLECFFVDPKGAKISKKW